MAYYSINSLCGTELIAVVQQQPYMVSEVYCVNEIAGVKIDGSVIRVRDSNGHEFLTIQADSKEEAQNWALCALGHTCYFDEPIDTPLFREDS